LITRAAHDCGSASSSQVALSRDLRVDCSGRTFLTYYYGNGGAKFSKKFGSYRNSSELIVRFEHLRFQMARSLACRRISRALHPFEDLLLDDAQVGKSWVVEWLVFDS